jgi:hypothetical protein
MSNAQNAKSEADLSRRTFLKAAAAVGLGVPVLAACTVPVAPTTEQESSGAPSAAVTTIEFWDMV